jgi:hypothetical protein
MAWLSCVGGMRHFLLILGENLQAIDGLLPEFMQALESDRHRGVSVLFDLVCQACCVKQDGETENSVILKLPQQLLSLLIRQFTVSGQHLPES